MEHLLVPSTRDPTVEKLSLGERKETSSVGSLWGFISSSYFRIWWLQRPNILFVSNLWVKRYCPISHMGAWRPRDSHRMWVSGRAKPQTHIFWLTYILLTPHTGSGLHRATHCSIHTALKPTPESSLTRSPSLQGEKEQLPAWACWVVFEVKKSWDQRKYFVEFSHLSLICWKP